MKEQLFKMNDYELLYLIHQGSDEALEIMFDKYQYLIYARVKRFNIPISLRDDFVQEGYIMLNKAIKTYKMESNKTFNKYFDLILQRRFISLIRINKTYQNYAVLMEEVNPSYESDATNDTSSIEVRESMFSKQEHLIFVNKYLNSMTTEEMVLKFGLTPKQIYNATVRIKAKLKQMNEVKK